MKHFITLMLCLALAVVAHATDVPLKVTDAFSAKFPNAKSVKWEKEGENYEAEFKADGQSYSAEFNSDGVWLETTEEIKYSSVPQSVKQTLDSLFSNKSITESEITESMNMGRHYEIELKSDGKRYVVTLSLSGQLIESKLL